MDWKCSGALCNHVSAPYQRRQSACNIQFDRSSIFLLTHTLREQYRGIVGGKLALALFPTRIRSFRPNRSLLFDQLTERNAFHPCPSIDEILTQGATFFSRRGVRLCQRTAGPPRPAKGPIFSGVDIEQHPKRHPMLGRGCR